MPVKEFITYNLKLLKSYKGRCASEVFSLLKTKSRVTSHQPPSTNHQLGFTLIEYLVAITVLAGLVAGVLITLDPFTQIQRGEDAQRRQDIQQIKNALEIYYQDYQCYPESIEFGQEWVEESTVYMSEVPQDPTCNGLDGTCYQYVTDTESANDCPQWNVVFAKLSQAPDQSTSICPLSDISSSCVPEGYDETWACTMSGAVNCQFLEVSGFGYDAGEDAGDATPTPTTATQPTPTLAEGAVNYSLGGQYNNNPYMKEMTISPLWAEPDEAQTFILSAEDSTSDITNVQVNLFSDNASQVLTLNHSQGSLTDGTWSGTIQVSDTYNETFVMAIVAENENGNEVCTVLAPRGSAPQADQICDDINN